MSDVSELWEEITTSFTFIRATDTEPTTDLKYMRRRLEKVIFDITGEPPENLNKHHFLSLKPVPKHSRENYCCSNKYFSKYTDPYNQWERETECYDCAGTEFCLCGHVIWWRYFLMHLESEKIILVGSCCVKRINPELGKIMEKELCGSIACKNLLLERNHAFEQIGYCSLKCLEHKEPKHELIKKCKACGRFLYPPSNYKDREFCVRSCKVDYKVFILKLEKLYSKKFLKFEEAELNLKQREEARLIADKARLAAIEEAKRKEDARRAIEEESRAAEEYKRNLMDPDVTLLCDCEKYYIPYKNRINCKDPVCFVCKVQQRKDPITQSILKWMADHDLVHIN